MIINRKPCSEGQINDVFAKFTSPSNDLGDSVLNILLKVPYSSAFSYNHRARNCI